MRILKLVTVHLRCLPTAHITAGIPAEASEIQQQQKLSLKGRLNIFISNPKDSVFFFKKVRKFIA